MIRAAIRIALAGLLGALAAFTGFVAIALWVGFWVWLIGEDGYSVAAIGGVGALVAMGGKFVEIVDERRDRELESLRHAQSDEDGEPEHLPPGTGTATITLSNAPLDAPGKF